MKIYSKFTKKEYELEVYEFDNGSKGIRYESLLNILENELHLPYELDVITATKDYSAVKCTIVDNPNKRKVIKTGECVITNKNPDFEKTHPLFIATKMAIRNAIISFLGIREDIVLDKDNTSEKKEIEDNNNNNNNKNIIKNTNDEEIDYGMSLAQEIMENNSSGLNEEISNNINIKRWNELKSKTMNGKTYEEIYKTSPRLDYILNSTDSKYNLLKEFIGLSKKIKK